MPADNKSSDTDRFQAPDGSVFEVTEDGSLSLLAIGYRGLMAWRAKRIEAAKGEERTQPHQHP